MNDVQTIIGQSNLFKAIDRALLPNLIQQSEPSFKSYVSGNRIWRAGEIAKTLGMVYSGKVQVIKENRRGNRTILTQILPSGIFGEAYAYAAVGSLPVSVDAVTDCQVLFFEPKKLLALGHLPGGQQVIGNLLQILAQKSLMLNQKIEILSQRKIEDKVLAFLHQEQKKQASAHLILPYNRQEMADFLGVERSALSAVLGEMQKAGVIIYHKNEFELLG